MDIYFLRHRHGESFFCFGYFSLCEYTKDDTLANSALVLVMASRMEMKIMNFSYRNEKIRYKFLANASTNVIDIGLRREFDIPTLVTKYWAYTVV